MAEDKTIQERRGEDEDPPEDNREIPIECIKNCQQYGLCGILDPAICPKEKDG